MQKGGMIPKESWLCFTNNDTFGHCLVTSCHYWFKFYNFPRTGKKVECQFSKCHMCGNPPLSVDNTWKQNHLWRLWATHVTELPDIDNAVNKSFCTWQQADKAVRNCISMTTWLVPCAVAAALTAAVAAAVARALELAVAAATFAAVAAAAVTLAAAVAAASFAAVATAVYYCCYCSDISSSSSRLDKQQFLPSQSSVSRCKVGSASTRSCRRCLNPALPSTATFAHITIMFYKMPQTIQPWQQYCVRSRSIQLCLRQNCRDWGDIEIFTTTGSRLRNFPLTFFRVGRW